MSAPDADVLILGGGSGGYACALRAAQLGLSVVVVERDLLGGTCLHRGCIPTKALLHAAEVADTAAEGSALGIHVTLERIDMGAVQSFKQRIVDRLHQGLGGLIAGAGITVVTGEGRVVGSTSVEVGGTTYTGRHLVIATGSAPRSLPTVPVGGNVVDSDGALALSTVPARAVVIGGSVIGVEFASMWRSLGAEVTVLEALDSLVPLEDPAIGRALQRAFRKRGIDVRTSSFVESVTSDPEGARVSLASGEVIEADTVLVAVGRVPRAEGLGLEEHGITVDRGWVVVDERLRAAPGVYAVGDVVRGLQLAHRGFAHGIFVAEEIAGLHPQPVEDREIPRVTYCDPEIASVGLTETEAIDLYGEVQSYEYALTGNGRSQILDATGFVKVVRQADGPILGVHMIGRRIGEQVGEATLVVGWEAFPEDVARFIHAHPTQNESLGEAAMALAGRPLHAHA